MTDEVPFALLLGTAYNPNTSFYMLIYQDGLPSTSCIPIHRSIGFGGKKRVLSLPQGLGQDTLLPQEVAI